jgi:hypothetical protein
VVQLSCFLLVSGDFVQTGGMDISNYNLARYLSQASPEVHLVSHRVQADLAALPNIRVHLVPKPLNSYFLGEQLLDRVGRFWARRLARRKVRVIVNGGNCDWGDINWVHYVHAVYEPRTQSKSLPRAAQLRVNHYVDRRRERRIYQAREGDRGELGTYAPRPDHPSRGRSRSCAYGLLWRRSPTFPAGFQRGAPARSR